MFFVIFPVAGLASVLFAALVWLFAPFIALACRPDGNLPGVLQLCQTFDATLDEGWKGGYFGQLSASPTGITLWWYRSRWLQRNPGYSLDFSILGMPFIQTQWTVVRCDGVNFYAKGPGGAFCLEGVNRWGLHYKFGWKAWNMYDPQAKTWKAAPEWRDGIIPICFTVSR